MPGQSACWEIDVVSYIEGRYSLAAGDVLIYGKQNEDQQIQLSHVGIYDGQGTVIHAGNDKDGVKASEYNYRPISKVIRILE